MAFTSQNLVNLIKLGIQHNASDIHIRTGETPCLRIRGELIPVQTKPFSAEDVRDICKILFNNDEIFARIDEIKEWDGGIAVSDLCRLRINFFRFLDKMGLVLRIVKTQVPTLQELKLSPTIESICRQETGLVLVTGPTGSGKSTTLAAMISQINHTRGAHIITIEDPIEYVHPQVKARISQREVGRDTPSFGDALRAALRQDPDIILVGEIRDAQTVETAMKASETGHLVFSTLHTTHSIATIGRIISMFPPDEQPDVRKRLAETLYATIGQRMLPRADGKGVVLAQEVMINTPGVKECILGVTPLGRINEIIAEGRGEGPFSTQTYDQHIMDLYNAKLITKETALDSVSSQSDFTQQLLVD